MNRQPIKYTAQEIKNWEIYRQDSTGNWILSRPYGHNLFSLWYRFKVAFEVFTGKADALYWELDNYNYSSIGDGYKDKIKVISHVRNACYEITSRWHLENGTSLYTSPPKREWVSVEELQKLYDDMFRHKDIAMTANSLLKLIKAAEIKEVNHG